MKKTADLFGVKGQVKKNYADRIEVNSFLEDFDKISYAAIRKAQKLKHL